MSFASPLALLALLALPVALLLLGLARRRRKRYAVRYPGATTLAALTVRDSRLRRIAPVALFLAALAALTVALARPQTTVAVAVRETDVILVTDASRSMLATDVSPSRLDAAKRAANDFVDKVPEGVRVGLIGYSGAPHTIEEPTDDRDRIRAAVEGLSADGATATGDSLQAALTLLDDQDEDDGGPRPTRAIVLLSDGESTTGVDPVAVARLAGREDVPVHTVALGTSNATIPLPGGGYIPVPPDPETLREISRASGGRAFTAAEAGELNAVYEELGSRIGSREEQREMTAAFAGGGLVLLLLAAAASLRTRARLP